MKENFEYWNTLVCADLASEDSLSKCLPPCPLLALASLDRMQPSYTWPTFYVIARFVPNKSNWYPEKG